MSIKEATWIDTRGHIHTVTGISHEAWAASYLRKEGRKPGMRAKEAFKASRFGRYDAGPAFFQLLIDGWVRQRGCDFTAWKLNGPTALSIGIGANHLWCPTIIAEACNDSGCKESRSWPNVGAMADDFNGIRSFRKGFNAKTNRCFRHKK